MNIQIAKVRDSGIRTAYVVNDDGSIQNRKRTLAIKMPKSCLEVATTGSVWSVNGAMSQRSYKINNFEVTEDLLTVNDANFLRPSGELLARWLSSNIEGCGDVKARRLVRALPNIDELVRNNDANALCAVSGVSLSLAQKIIAEWPSDALYAVLKWLQDSGLPMGLADRLARVYGEEALEKLSHDPFILLAFGVSFNSIKDVIGKLDIDVPDERIVAAMAEHVTNTYCKRTGSTVITEADLLAGMFKLDESFLQTIAKRSDPVCNGDVITANAGIDKGLVQHALTYGALLPVDGGYQGLGAAIQEATVAKFLRFNNERTPGAGSLLAFWEKNLTDVVVDDALIRFEMGLSFNLTDEQRDAIIMAVKSPISVISGGAGTGKTTILQAILSVFDQLADDMPQFQVALSGRAARRMSEATGRNAVTIAKLIADHLGEDKNPLPEYMLLIVDEASMVDLLSFYKLVGILPYATRIIFVGDVAQLPPVGAGLIFHALMQTDLPSVELTQVKRQGEDSGIHALATSIRNGIYEPALLSSSSGDVRYLPTADEHVILSEFQKADTVEQCIVLTPTRKGDFGVNAVNQMIQASFDDDCPPELHYADDLRGNIPWITANGSRLRLGDRIMVTANDYEADIRNGDLGTITAVYDEPEDGAFGEIDIDGNIVPITFEVLHNIDLGYAVTIHKSQGSQWKTCILLLPSYAPHMVDQTLLYTAVTRPTQELVVIGDQGLVAQAINRGASVSERLTDLANKL